MVVVVKKERRRRRVVAVVGWRRQIRRFGLGAGCGSFQHILIIIMWLFLEEEEEEEDGRCYWFITYERERLNIGRVAMHACMHQISVTGCRQHAMGNNNGAGNVLRYPL